MDTAVCGVHGVARCMPQTHIHGQRGKVTCGGAMHVRVRLSLAPQLRIATLLEYQP